MGVWRVVFIIVIIINFIGNSNIYRENKKIQSTPKKLCKSSKDENRRPSILGKIIEIPTTQFPIPPHYKQTFMKLFPRLFLRISIL